tara:strand:- start:456 stop:689 length:234 start_codon:yes stop_codon:yes gene_type:complete
MPYIKKSEFIYLQKKISMRQDRDEYNQLFDDYIREHNYELWSFAHSDIKRKLGITKHWDKGLIKFPNSNEELLKTNK